MVPARTAAQGQRKYERRYRQYSRGPVCSRWSRAFCSRLAACKGAAGRPWMKLRERCTASSMAPRGSALKCGTQLSPRPRSPQMVVHQSMRVGCKVPGLNVQGLLCCIPARGLACLKAVVGVCCWSMSLSPPQVHAAHRYLLTEKLLLHKALPPPVLDLLFKLLEAWDRGDPPSRPGDGTGTPGDPENTGSQGLDLSRVTLLVAQVCLLPHVSSTACHVPSSY